MHPSIHPSIQKKKKKFQLQNLHLHGNYVHGNVAQEVLDNCLPRPATLFHPCTNEMKQSKYTRLWFSVSFDLFTGWLQLPRYVKVQT